MEQGFVVAVADAPSDRPSGLTDPFPTGDDHVTDIRKVLDVLAAKQPGPVFLMGASRRTVSAAPCSSSTITTTAEALSAHGFLGEEREVVDASRLYTCLAVIHHILGPCFASVRDDFRKLTLPRSSIAQLSPEDTEF